MEAELKYPVFNFVKNDNTVYVYYNDKDNKTTNTQYLKKYKYRIKGIMIVDSSGTKYIVKDVFKTKWRGIYGYFTGMQGRVISIDFDYEDETTKVSLEELKEMILNRYPKSRWFHSAWVDVEEFKEEMDKCTTFEEVAQVVGGPPPSSNFFSRILRGY